MWVDPKARVDCIEPERAIGQKHSNPAQVSDDLLHMVLDDGYAALALGRGPPR